MKPKLFNGKTWKCWGGFTDPRNQTWSLSIRMGKKIPSLKNNHGYWDFGLIFIFKMYFYYSLDNMVVSKFMVLWNKVIAHSLSQKYPRQHYVLFRTALLFILLRYLHYCLVSIYIQSSSICHHLIWLSCFLSICYRMLIT